MKKKIGKVEELREKYLEKQKQLKTEVKNKELAKELKNVAYTIVQNPETKSREFLIVKIKFDIDANQCIIDGVRDFEDKAAGLAFVMNNNNLEFLYNKNKELKK